MNFEVLRIVGVLVVRTDAERMAEHHSSAVPPFRMPRPSVCMHVLGLTHAIIL